MGRKCAVLFCTSESGRDEDIGVTFHKIPLHADIRPKWMNLCRIPEDKRSTKVIYVCSRHFLSVDFCHFKGRKYMLKQGVLPSVFPWECDPFQQSWEQEPEIKVEAMDIKMEVLESDFNASVALSDNVDKMNTSYSAVKNEQPVPSELAMIEQKVKTIDTATGTISFTVNTKIEALDFNQVWSPAKIIEVDEQENEVLVHFEQYSNKYDEWISMNSTALRAVPNSVKKSYETFSVGERCLASWSDARKFPATITKILDNGE